VEQDYRSADRLPEAIELFETTIRQREDELGPDDPDTLTSYNNLADALNTDGQFDRAIVIHRTVFQRRKDSVGEDHPHALLTRHNLADTMIYAGLLNEAIETQRVLAPIDPKPREHHTRAANSSIIRSRPLPKKYSESELF
jgi:tetratricopeptide (TPR) repeat protein